MLNVKVKKLTENAVIPSYQKPGDCGLDLTAVSMTQKNNMLEYGTGLAFEIPAGYVGLVFPRSSIYKTDQILTNAVGVIDSGYRGEVKLIFTLNVAVGERGVIYEVGDRIAQLIIMPHPAITLEPVQELTETVRGATGFGSSGGSKQNNTDQIISSFFYNGGF